MDNNDQEKFEVRDLRERNRYVVDIKFLNGYARFLRIYAVGVYDSLCRHANKEQKCWPSINKIATELDICRNKVIESIKYLEFWQIIKKRRVGKEATNRYFLLDKKHWKPLNEENLKQLSEVYHINFKSLQDKLQEFIASTSIVRKHNGKELQKKGDCSVNKKKPYFWGMPMWKDEKNGKWWVIHGQDDFREFTEKESKIEWR